VRIRAHPSFPTRRQLGEIADERAGLVEELLGAVALEPRLEQREVLRVVAYAGQWDLVRPPGPFDRNAVDLLRACPAFRRPQDDHRPRGAAVGTARSRRILESGDVVERLVERPRERAVHLRRIVAGDEERPPAVALKERGELGLGDSREHRRVGDLVAVQMEDGQHRAVMTRAQELGSVPTRRERA